MPLNKPIGYNGLDLPYKEKLNLVESLCKGCHYFVFDDSKDELECGCIYPDDIRGFNPFIRSPYLTVEEIAMNTCEFWKLPITHKTQEEQNSLSNDWEDVATTPSQLLFKDADGVYQFPVMKHSEPLILYGKNDE